ncbi:retrotransposon protein, putative, ty1-copia subclass [Tanacetum coccineum]
MTTSVENNSVFRSFFEKQKLTGPNFIDWYRQLRLVLLTEDKENYIEHHISVAPVAQPGQQVPPTALAAHAAWVKGQKEVAELKALYSKQAERELLHTVREFYACKQEEGQSVSSHLLKMKSYIDNLERLGQPVSQNLAVSLILVSLSKDYDSFVQNYNMHGMGKTENELHAMLKLHEDTLPKKDANPALHARAGRVQKNQKNKLHKAAKGGHGKGNNKIGYVRNNVPFAPKPKTPPPFKKENPTKDVIYHQCREVGHWRRNCPVYLAELIKKKKLSLRGLRGSQKLKPGALSLYVGDGHCAAVEAIRTYHLELPSGLVIVLNNCHYAPSITRGVISVSRLFDDGFINRFDENNVISVLKNNLVYFMAVPRDGIFEIDMSCSNTNDSFMYAITNKRAKINLDSSLLWHCRLGHISKKRIEKLQHDRLLNSINIESLGNQEFLDHLKEHGIIAHRTPPYTPQNNGVSERRNRTLLDMVRSMMSQTTLPKSFWDYALETAARILNMVPSKKVDKTPYEIWHGQAPKLSYLRVWGCEAFVKHDTLTKPDKLDPRSFKCIFVGYPKETMGYSFYSPSENKVFVARNAEFFESKLLDLKASGSVEDLEEIQEEDTNPSVDTSLNHEEDDQEIDEPQSDINPIRRSTRTRRPTDRLCLYIDTEEHELGDLGEPANYRAALLDPESKKWLDAMNVEMQSMKDNDVWVLVELPPNARTVGSKWLFKKKTDMDGAVYIFKARLVAKGFTQTYGVDYEETFSPVADIRAIRILIAIAAYYDYEIWQMDVKTAFLNGHLSEEVYMEQPEGFVNPKYPNHVCKLKRSIYGLKQASRQWNKRFDDEIKKFGFTQNPDEPCVYLKASGSYVAILILYVDDILLMGNNIPMLQDVKSYLGRSFAMKDLGDAAYILGIKIYRDRSKRLIGLNQSAYIEKILKRFYMENSKRGTIPMQEKLKLSKSQGASTPAEKQRMQNIPYASAIYYNPGEIHWTTVKNILKYLRNTKDMFLVYGGNMERELRVSCYTDAGYLTDADDLRLATNWICLVLCVCVCVWCIDWKAQKQSSLLLSSTDAEYIVAFDASKEAVWIRKFIFGLGVVPIIKEPISMYCDNTGDFAIRKIQNHIKVIGFFAQKVYLSLRGTIEMGDVKI